MIGVMSVNEKEIVQGFSLSDKSACIIGCGGLGCNIAVHLVGSGIGKRYLCDFDVVSSSNLNRQFLYTENDIGESKCMRAKHRLIKYSTDTQIFAMEEKILDSEDLSFAKDCDIIILAVDNPECRKAVQSFCISKNKPLVCGGIDGFYGMAYLFIPDVSPCLECAGFLENNKAESNISSTAGIIGSMEANLTIRYLLTNDVNLSGKITIFDESSFDTLKIKPSALCSVCKNNS